jgi:hypothetical protein
MTSASCTRDWRRFLIRVGKNKGNGMRDELTMALCAVRKATEWNENEGDPASADTPKERVNEVALRTWLKNCDSTAAEAL